MNRTGGGFPRRVRIGQAADHARRNAFDIDLPADVVVARIDEHTFNAPPRFGELRRLRDVRRLIAVEDDRCFGRHRKALQAVKQAGGMGFPVSLSDRCRVGMGIGRCVFQRRAQRTVVVALQCRGQPLLQCFRHGHGTGVGSGARDRRRTGNDVEVLLHVEVAHFFFQIAVRPVADEHDGRPGGVGGVQQFARARHQRDPDARERHLAWPGRPQAEGWPPAGCIPARTACTQR